MTRRFKVPVYPVAQGAGARYRVQRLIGRADGNRVWGTVLTARPAVAERILAHMRTDGKRVRLLQR